MHNRKEEREVKTRRDRGRKEKGRKGSSEEEKGRERDVWMLSLQEKQEARRSSSFEAGCRACLLGERTVGLVPVVQLAGCEVGLQAANHRAHVTDGASGVASWVSRQQRRSQ